MNKVAHYLQEHLVGEVTANADARRYFSTDASVLSVVPMMIVYPRNENDIRKSTRFTWQLAERGRNIPITARGAGTDQSGAALGNGIMMVFPAHLNRILELDDKSGLVTVEPGINYAKLQQALLTHGRFLPPYPSSAEYSTIGGAIGNNTSGEKSVKYGDTLKYVKRLRVVLANGEVIETGRLSKRELNKKLGLSSFEGEVYRAVDKLLEENSETLKSSKLATVKNAAGYNIWDIKRKDGFDLTPLFVGSQGTLGIVTEATLATEPYNPRTTLIAASFDTLETAEVVLNEIKSLPASPSALELVDSNLIDFVNAHNPNLLKGIIHGTTPKLMLLIEFDNSAERLQKRLVKKTRKILERNEVQFRIETEESAKEQLWKVRHSAAVVTSYSTGNERALPIIEDGVVPQDRFSEYLKGLYSLLGKYNVNSAVWGHAGESNLHVQPFFDLGQVGDRQKIFKLMDDYYTLVTSLGGSTTGEHNDGRLRGAYLKLLYGDAVYEFFKDIKKIFDPYNTLNPGVKLDVTVDAIKPLLRQEYSLQHLHDYMPHS